MVNLSEAFFPTNRQQSISVQVAYHFNGSNETQGHSQDLREGGAWDEWFV